MTAWPTESEVKAMFPRKEGFGDDVTLAAIAQLPEVRALAEVRDLLLSGQIREALAVIDNEQAIYMAKREPRKVRAV